jgi:hypothetical protein
MDEKEKARLSLCIVNWLAPFSVGGVGFGLPAFENVIQANTPSALAEEEKAERANACIKALEEKNLVKPGLFLRTYTASSTATFAPSTSSDPWAWEEK